VKKREAPSVLAAPMPDPARSTAKNKVLHIAAIIKNLYRRGGFPPLLLILRKIKQKQGKYEKQKWFSSFVDSMIKKIMKGF